MSVEEVLDLALLLLFLGCGLAATGLWWRRRTPSGAWMAATFLAIDVVLVVGQVAGEDPDHPFVVERSLLLCLLAFPYLLYRFADSVVGAGRGPRRAADGVMALIAVLTFVPATLSETYDFETGLQQFYGVFALGAWLLLAVASAWLLARASRRQPGVVRNRLRLLGAAALVIALALPGSVIAGEGVVSDYIVLGLGGVAGVLFLVAFVTPGFLRTAWRHREERRLYDAAVGFMAAESLDDVAEVLVPQVRALLGSPRVTLYTKNGEVLASDRGPPAGPSRRFDVESMTLAGRRLDVELAPTMPLFGHDENELVERLSLLAELALDRARLLQSEREARESLHAVNAELEGFVYTTSHDLRNPVIALLGYVEVLREDHGGDLPDRAQHYIDRMAANARHMEALIQDLLELSRVGRVDAEPELVDLAAIVNDVCSDLSRHHPDLIVTCDDLPEVWINPTRARQLFTNLLENAARYAGHDHVQVAVTATRDGDRWRVVVADDGVGIPESHLDRVFGVFERLAADDGTGTGMGLAICRRIVESAGGQIRARPSDLGAVFEIELPVLEDARIPTDRQEAAL